MSAIQFYRVNWILKFRPFVSLSSSRDAKIHVVTYFYTEIEKFSNSNFHIPLAALCTYIYIIC